MLRMDNAKEFRSKHFEDYCIATKIDLTYVVPYEHFENGLAKAFIKKIQLISRLLLLHAGLPSTMWAHVVLHAATLLRFRSTLLNDHSPLELLMGQTPNVSHFWPFGCEVWVPMAEPHCKTIGRHRLEGIYVGFDSPNIIRYILPSTSILHKARFQNCQFDESKFPTIASSQPPTTLDFWALETFTMNPDPRTALADTEVKKLLDLQILAEHLLDGFSNTLHITRNPLSGAGQPLIRIFPEKPNLATLAPSAKRPKASHHSDLSALPDSEPEHLEHVSNFVHSLVMLESDPLMLE